MDLEEWELLPNDGFLEIHDDGGKMIFSRKYTSNSKNDFNMNYFNCPSPNLPNQIVPFQIQETPYEVPLEINMLPSQENCEKIIMMEVEQDHEVSQVYFKKENEFENMKIDSPKSKNNTLLSQVDDVLEVEKEIMIKKIGIEEEEFEEKNGGLNLLNMSLNGIGAIFSFGVAAAATICIIFIGNRQKHKQNQKLRFQILSDDKRMKQVVHHTTRLNEAISAVRGVPFTRAQITVGGHYDAL